MVPGTHFLGSEMRANIYRQYSTTNNQGKAFLQSWQVVAPEHSIELTALSHREQIEAEQLKVKVTHIVFPELRNVKSVRIGDYYMTGSSLYKIVEKNFDDRFGYFRVFENSAGFNNAANDLNRSYFASLNLTPSSFLFGSGALAAIPAFLNTPIPFVTKKSQGGVYLANLSGSGFTLGATGFGEAPRADLAFYENVSNSGLWMATGLTPGVHTFATVIGIPFITPAPDVFVIDEGPATMSVQITNTGFTLTPTGFGGNPTATVVIWEKPKVGENRWSISGLTPGNYTFGAGPLANIKGLINTPDIYPYNTGQGDHYLTDITSAGFKLYSSVGNPTVSMVIVKK